MSLSQVAQDVVEGGHRVVCVVVEQVGVDSLRDHRVLVQSEADYDSVNCTRTMAVAHYRADSVPASVTAAYPETAQALAQRTTTGDPVVW